MYKIFEELCKENCVTPYRVCKETGITTATISNWKAGRYTPKADKMQKIADYFGVSLEYLMTGEVLTVSIQSQESTKSELTARDERDIAKDLDNIMAKIRSGEDSPLRYNGQEIDERSLNLLESAIEMSLRDLKTINKEKYNPHKNNK